MVFTRTKRTAAKVADELTERGFAAAAVHGDLGQGAREQALRAFRSGKVDVLVATDVAARGIDVDDVTHVINYQCPEEDKTYIHRIGRTGRAGKTGIAVSFIDWDDMPRWKLINETLGLDFADPAETYSTSEHLSRTWTSRTASPAGCPLSQAHPRRAGRRARRQRGRRRQRPQAGSRPFRRGAHRTGHAGAHPQAAQPHPRRSRRDRGVAASEPTAPTTAPTTGPEAVTDGESRGGAVAAAGPGAGTRASGRRHQHAGRRRELSGDERPTRHPAPRRTAPERRRRGDVITAVALVVLLGVAAARGVAHQPGGRHRQHPRQHTACGPQPARRRARGLRRGVARSERRHPRTGRGGSRPWSPATAAPSKGMTPQPAPWPGATTAIWRCARSAPGFPGTDDGDGHALALYAGRTGWCSELTALHPSSGKRADASNPDMRPGATSSPTARTSPPPGPTYMEVWRSDLVRTLEYGDVPTPGSREAAASGVHVRLHSGQQRPHRRHRALPRRSLRPAHRAHPGRLQGRRHPRAAVLRRAPRRRRCARGALGRPGRGCGARAAAADRVRQGRAAAEPGAPRRPRLGVGHLRPPGRPPP